MPSLKSSARITPMGSTVVILAAIAGLALAGCSHPANNTDSSADSTAAASDATVTATPAASDAMPAASDASMSASSASSASSQ
jgi:uncharacterized lipoprotein YajG